MLMTMFINDLRYALLLDLVPFIIIGIFLINKNLKNKKIMHDNISKETYLYLKSFYNNRKISMSEFNQKYLNIYFNNKYPNMLNNLDEEQKLDFYEKILSVKNLETESVKKSLNKYIELDYNSNKSLNYSFFKNYYENNIHNKFLEEKKFTSKSSEYTDLLNDENLVASINKYLIILNEDDKRNYEYLSQTPDVSLDINKTIKEIDDKIYKISKFKTELLDVRKANEMLLNIYNKKFYLNNEQDSSEIENLIKVSLVNRASDGFLDCLYKLNEKICNNIS